MGCKVKCMYYSEECADYCKYAAILSSEIPYAKIVRDAQGIYMNKTDYCGLEEDYY